MKLIEVHLIKKTTLFKDPLKIYYYARKRATLPSILAQTNPILTLYSTYFKSFLLHSRLHFGLSSDLSLKVLWLSFYPYFSCVPCVLHIRLILWFHIWSPTSHMVKRTNYLWNFSLKNFSLLSPCILLSTTFWNTFNLCMFSLGTNRPVSHRYKRSLSPAHFKT
jgi:hypothetical protein